MNFTHVRENILANSYLPNYMTDEFLPKSENSLGSPESEKSQSDAIPFWGEVPEAKPEISAIEPSDQSQEVLAKNNNFWSSDPINNQPAENDSLDDYDKKSNDESKINVELRDFPIYDWDSDNDALKIVDWYNENSVASGRKNLDFFKSKSGVRELRNNSDAQKILDSAIQTLLDEGVTECRPPYNYHTDNDENGWQNNSNLDLSAYQNKQVGFAIIGVLLIIASSIFFPLGILRFQEMNEFLEYSEEAEDWPSVQVNNNSWAYAYYDETCSYDSESGETCSYDYEFGAQVHISCLQDDNATWICDNNLENGKEFSSRFFCTSTFFAERGEGDMPYPCAAMLGMRDIFGSDGQSFPVEIYDTNMENGINHWIIYDGECFWNDGHRDSIVDSWSCYNSNTEYDTWWYYCEYKENYGLWSCTDDLGENSGAEENRAETRAPAWIVNEAYELTGSIEDFTIKYDPDNPNRMYLQQSNPSYVRGVMLQPILTMVITPIVFLVISIRSYKWSLSGFVFDDSDDD